MTDWRNYAQRHEWWKIETARMTGEERSELIEILNSALPKTERGHGLEAFDGVIAPRHARSFADAEAAQLYENLLREGDSDHQSGTDPFAEPYEFAVSYVGRCGLQYEGWNETYLYWTPEKKSWTQFPSHDARQVIAFREQRIADIVDLPREQAIKAYEALELDSKPWRNVQPLSLLFRLDRFELYTPLWHAFNILNFTDSFRQELRPTIEFFATNDIGLDADRIAYSALAVGRSWEALRKKYAEKHAIRGIKIKKAAKSGGDARRVALAPDTEKRLREMGRLVGSGRSVKDAAEAIARKGLGPNGNANRALWYRHNPKML